MESSPNAKDRLREDGFVKCTPRCCETQGAALHPCCCVAPFNAWSVGKPQARAASCRGSAIHPRSWCTSLFSSYFKIPMVIAQRFYTGLRKRRPPARSGGTSQIGAQMTAPSPAWRPSREFVCSGRPKQPCRNMCAPHATAPQFTSISKSHMALSTTIVYHLP